jgi:hypothetical protein
MLGKPLRKSFLASRLCASHHFFRFEGVGEILGMLGGDVGEIGSGVLGGKRKPLPMGGGRPLCR